MASNKDVKHSVLSTRLSRAAPAPIAQSRRNADDKTTKTDPDTPTPPPTPNGLAEKIFSKLKVDISKLDPATDGATIKLAESAVAQLLGAGNGGAGNSSRQLKRSFQQFQNVGLGAGNCNAGLAMQTTITNTTMANYPGGSAIGQIFSGNTIITRIGRKIRLHELTLRFNCNWDSLNSSIGNVGPLNEYLQPFRVTVLRDKQSIVAAGTNCSTTVGSQVDTRGVFINQDTTANWIGHLAAFNPTTKGYRYEILHDDWINPPANATCVTGVGTSASDYSCNAQFAHKIHIPIHGVNVMFADDAVSGSTTIIENDIFILFSVDTTVTAIPPTIDMYEELTWEDIV